MGDKRYLKAKAYLSKIRALKKGCDDLEVEVERKRAELTSVSAVSISGERVQGGIISHDKIGDSVADIDTLSRKLYKARFEYELAKVDAEKKIQLLENHIYRDILAGYYIEGKSFKSISEKLFYNYNYLTQLHRKALSDFEHITEM